MRARLVMSVMGIALQRQVSAYWVGTTTRQIRRYPTSPCLLLSIPRGLASRQYATKDSKSDQVVEIKRLAGEAITLYKQNLHSATPLGNLYTLISDLEREQSDPDFWNESNAARAAIVNSQLSTFIRLKSRLEQWQKLSGDVQAALDMLAANATADEHEMLLDELHTASSQLLQDNQRYELELLLSGPFDAAPARIILTAGAGGTEANDWVASLSRMYQRHATRMGFQCVVEDEQAGEVVGYKSVELVVTGPNAFGWFSGEKGAHRLVRLSPFNANNKRQTTFAGVDVAPDIWNDELEEVVIPEKDLEVTAIRAGGKGGQAVNKQSTAVRIKHLPTGLQVKCTQERSQSLNKVIAMKRLKAQLMAIAQEQRVQEIQQIRGDVVEASWGAQIRNYVLHPYKMIKDQRTGWETTNAQSFLDGDLEECIAVYLRFKAAERRAV